METCVTVREDNGYYEMTNAEPEEFDPDDYEALRVIEGLMGWDEFTWAVQVSQTFAGTRFTPILFVTGPEPTEFGEFDEDI